ncbi:MAG: TrkH family potassium uptake protein [Planctomycetia bacterium]|nr:TrkH family potassium uptake protein [Planctomycetia bacterium]
MNYRIIARFLSVVSFIVGFSMLLSLPWAFSLFGGDWQHEERAFFGLILSALVSFACGGLLRLFGKDATGELLRKETLVIVAFSWILATLLGALPYILSQTMRDVGVRMSVGDAIFESQSGISTTGASVIACLENPACVPRSILFWRSTTHFLGGFGFMALFVVLLGQGTSGKAVLRIEQTKVTPRTPQAKIRETLRLLVGIYLGLNAVLFLCLWALGLSVFDALSHAFSTVSTGGFSTFQMSIGHFAANTDLNAGLIESTLIFFMILGGTNFVLLYWCLRGQPGKMFADTEWRTYIGIITVSTILLFAFGLFYDDFTSPDKAGQAAESSFDFAMILVGHLRTCLFQATSIMTSTGFVTTEYENWNALSVLVVLLLMYIGGCSGSTAGGTKVIRSVLGFKLLEQEVERTWRPNVVRSVQVGRDQTVDRDVISGVIFFLLLFIVMIVVTALCVLAIEPNTIWNQTGKDQTDKFADILAASLSMYSNIGPALGVAGADGNFGGFTEATKIIFSWAMLLGRLELFTVLALFLPSFWRKR